MAANGDGATYGCPACGATLYGWAAARHPVDRSEIVLDHCESCGLVITRGAQPPDPDAELDQLERRGDLIVAPNRESLQGGIGGPGWAGMEPERRRLHLNPRAARLLLRRRGVEVLDCSTPFSRRSWAAMLQTLVNAFTLRANFWRNARAGRLPGRRPSYALDAIVSVLVAVPLSLLALVLELAGSLLGRGGIMELRTAADPDPADGAAAGG